MRGRLRNSKQLAKDDLVQALPLGVASQRPLHFGSRYSEFSGNPRRRDIEAVYGAEGTARLGLMLERLLAGLDVLGVERERALKVVESVLMDSVPAIRRDAYEFARQRRDLYGKPEEFKTASLANSLGLPRSTVRYALEDLTAYGLIHRRSNETDKGKVTDFWRFIDYEADET